MDSISDENYVISQAKKESDPYTAKAWILTAKTLFPNSFQVQYEAYKLEKAASNYEEAAKCLSYIILTYQNQNHQHVDLWNEVSELTNALRVPENEITPKQEFYVKMFQHVSYDVQHKILLLTANHSDNNIDHCKFLILLLKRFPQTIVSHSVRLIEAITQGMQVSPQIFQEILVHEALPLISIKTPELPSHLVYGIFTISLEYYIKQIIDENQEDKSVIYNVWKEIFQILTLCGKILKWDNFLPFNKNWSKDIYWQKLVQIVAADPSHTSEKKQILFYATTLFILSLQDYITNTKIQTGKGELEFVLVEGFRETWDDCQSNIPKSREITQIEQPKISVTPPCNRETPISFVTAANCWHLLNSNEQFQRDFSQLLIKLPLSQWISRFLFDLAVYFGHHEEAKKLLNDMQITNIRQNIRILSLSLISASLTLQSFECTLKILVELPSIKGNIIDTMASPTHQRHLILLPLTQNAIIQYCTRAIITALSRKIYETNCSDSVLGDLLVLTQLEYPNEMSHLVEHIFELIRSRRHFTYLLFPNYIIHIDYLEEFMNIWYSHNGEFNLEFIQQTQSNLGTRRIGTRGADKGVREDFKQIMKQQVSRSNEDITNLILQFITQERLHLIQNIF